MFYIGVDLGQKHDYTAIVIIQREDPRHAEGARLYGPQPLYTAQLVVRCVERIALGTPYPRIADHIRALTHRYPYAGRCSLVVDASGVGAPVVDMLREPGLGCSLTAVTITGGARSHQRTPMSVTVPRRDLISGLQLAFEKGHLKIVRRLPEAHLLINELKSLPDEGPAGDHDDLVIALALACWRARSKSVWSQGRLPGI